MTLLEALTEMLNVHHEYYTKQESETLLRTIHFLQEVRDRGNDLQDYLEVEAFLEWLKKEVS